MALGKYSPTVSGWYSRDQKWFKKNGGDFENGKDPNSLYDNDGYDSYGYNENDIDREGNKEDIYMIEDESLFNSIQESWYNKKMPYEKDKKLKNKVK